MENESDFLKPGRYRRAIRDRSDVNGPARCCVRLVLRVLEFERCKLVGGRANYEGPRDLLVLDATIRFVGGHGEDYLGGWLSLSRWRMKYLGGVSIVWLA